MTLIEVITALAIAALVTSSLYLLVATGVRGRLIVQARVADQEWGRQAVSLLADRIRQANYDQAAACPDGLLLTGSGQGFDQRFAFRAILDEDLSPPRRTYVFYVEDGRLWQETRPPEGPGECDDERIRQAPDPGRIALTPSIIEAFELTPLEAGGAIAEVATRARTIRIRVVVKTQSAPGRVETQTYQTVVAVRGP
jgi:hypothetical protein